ncbi:(2Fe-2S)-binding protein [Amycolatopsis sp. K13G38]|uniref:(2Fe-2S)-binding protein n=1 Tax=Amycolatopsis acididurans TaxID=2724524 RepID=A0ABX1JD41_9PSEU|nr:(2Fe-2S)-binding protein [Amycolatopsis acididurans]NKQ57705.1 (2Fe-2S)-binding protein [Amycolatopsis acididurans]
MSGDRLTFTVDGQAIEARRGQTVAGALLAAGRKMTRRTAGHGAARGVFCGMGVCQECLVAVVGGEPIRSCTTPVTEGLVVETGSEGGVTPS